MSKKRLLHITYGSASHAPRLIHAGRSGVNYGYDVKIIGAPREAFPAQPTEETRDGMYVYLIPLLTRVRFVDLLSAFKRWFVMDLGAETVPMPRNRIRTRTALNVLLFNLWILRLGWKLNPEIIHCHEIWGLPASVLLAKLRRIPIIYDVWDPHFLQFRSPRTNQIVGSIEKFLARRVNAVVTASGRMKAYFQNVGVQEVEYIGNWKRPEDYDVIEAERLEKLRHELDIPDDALIVSYIGLLFDTREIPALLKAMELIPDIYLIIAGRGSFRDDVIKAAERLPNIKWLDWVDLSDVPLYTCLSDVVYWCVEDVPVSHMIVANKLFETFMAGNVMLARYGVGEMSEILDETQTGYLLQEVSPETIAQALRELQNPDLLQAYKQRSFAVREEYAWSKGESMLIDLYSRLLN